MSRILFHSVCLICFFLFTNCNSAFVDEGLIPVNGTELYVKVMGEREGEPLVLLHGGPGLSHDYFLPHLSPLSDHLQLILFDQRGMGRSSVDLDSTSFSLDLIVEDIDKLREELGHDRIHLLGHSWGGMLAMRYAIRYPGRLKSLILSNTVPASSEFTEATMAGFARLQERQNMDDLQPLMEQAAAGSRDTALYNRILKLNFRPTFYDTANVNRLNLNLQENYFKTRELLNYLPPPAMPVNLLPELQQLPVPTLILRGETEPIPEASDRRIQDTISGSQLISLPHTGHFPFIEQPQEFMDTLLGFIRETEQ